MEEIIFPAHIRYEGSKRIIQTVDEHNRNVAKYAKQALEKIGLGNTGYLAGFLHDIGKYTDEFSKYINAVTDPRIPDAKRPARGTVNHTFAGVRLVYQEIKGSNEAPGILTKDVIAYAIGAHHGQFDCIDETGRNGFAYRCEKEDPVIDEGIRNFKRNVDLSIVNELFSKAEQEVAQYMHGIHDLSSELVNQLDNPVSTLTPQELKNRKWEAFDFYCGCLARLVLSAVIDGDRRDTAEFIDNFKIPQSENMHDTWNRELEFAEQKMKRFDQSSTINQARTKISDLCKQASKKESGIFVLNVPTGAGKTISSLRFALSHAVLQKKERIIFTSPLLSILEQNAAVIRSFISDQNLVLEHHSNAVDPETDGMELNQNELLVETWDAPIIITSMVQLLNTFFDGRTSCIRRFRSLCHSIIVIDEVQTVPPNLLAMFNSMISFLSECCDATIVLCSATQPAWDQADYPLAILSDRNIVPYSESIWNVFKRTEIIDAGKCRFQDELPQRIEEIVEKKKSLLVICNKKSESEFLYQVLSQKYECYHISASMCMKHRRSVLKTIRKRLAQNEDKPLICISTQVIEAGVDISFECVIRLLAGMDNVVQAAGRCNRNGESAKLGEVYTISCSDENLKKLREIQREKSASTEFLYEFHKSEKMYDNDLASDKSIHTYYSYLYKNMDADFQEDKVEQKNFTVFSLLSWNRQMLRNSQDKHLLNQSFKMAGQYFKVFDDSTKDVIVPYEKGKDIISDLCSQKAEYDRAFVKSCLKKARNYTVTIYPWQLDQLKKENAICEVPDLETYYLSDGYYTESTGLILKPEERTYLEV